MHANFSGQIRIIKVVDLIDTFNIIMKPQLTPVPYFRLTTFNLMTVGKMVIINSAASSVKMLFYTQ